MYFKIHESKYGLMVAACDENLSGKHMKFKKIDFFVNPRFYGDEHIGKQALINLLRTASSCNLVGKEAVECGIESGLVEKQNIIKIGKVPHAQGVVIFH
ncbi:MAG: DUF424 family protein [DPANN group archaeon]|nr:DUF424 family protein [DPANN group archaeon]